MGFDDVVRRLGRRASAVIFGFRDEVVRLGDVAIARKPAFCGSARPLAGLGVAFHIAFDDAIVGLDDVAIGFDDVIVGFGDVVVGLDDVAALATRRLTAPRGASANCQAS